MFSLLRKFFYFSFVLIVCGFVFTACPNTTGPNTTTDTGSISGKAFFSNSTDHSGITVTLEKTDGLLSLAAVEAARNIASGARSVDAARSLAGTTRTGTDGSYSFNNLAPGPYTVYASSQNSKERAMAVNITVVADQTVTAKDLVLTPVGSITGRIKLDGNETGNSGFLVSVAGTSYMAATADDGNFTISDIPAGDNYLIIIIKGNYTDVWTTELQSVTGGGTTNLDSKTINSAELGRGIIWKGALASAPANPQPNWAYHNTTDKTTYIWSGSKWDVLVAQGEKGDPGTPGVSLLWKGEYANAALLIAANGDPKLNWAYYNTTDKISYIYNGTAWQVLVKDGAIGPEGPAGTGKDGVSITWKGEYENLAALIAENGAPQLNWAYYDITNKTAYIYSGNRWYVLAKDGTGTESGGGSGDIPAGLIGTWTDSYPGYFEELWEISADYLLTITGWAMYEGGPWSEDGYEGTIVNHRADGPGAGYITIQYEFNSSYDEAPGHFYVIHYKNLTSTTVLISAATKLDDPEFDMSDPNAPGGKTTQAAAEAAYTVEGGYFEYYSNLTKEQGSGPSAPVALADGVWKDGELTGGNSVDRYIFTVTGGKTYSVWWNDSYDGDDSKTADVEVKAEYGDGTVIFNWEDAGWTDPQTFTAGSTSIVYVSVRPLEQNPNEAGTYSVMYNAESGGGDDNVLVDGVWKDGTLTGGGSTGWYTFDVENAKTYYVWWNDKGNGPTTLNKTGDVQVRVTYDNGTQIFDWTDHGWTTPQMFTAGKNDTVHVQVRPYGNNSSNAGTYGIAFSTFSLRPGVNPVPTALTVNQWADSALSDKDDIHVYTFDIVSGTTYYIWWNDGGEANSGDGTKTADIQVQARWADGDRLQFGSGGTYGAQWVTAAWAAPQTIAGTAISNGTIQLRVRAYNGGATFTGTYGIVYSTVNTMPGKGTAEFQSVTATGTPTTALNLTFDKEIEGLTAADIALSGLPGVTKGTLSGPSGAGPYTYTLPITVALSGTLNVAVAKTMYTIDGSPETVTVTGSVTPVELVADTWANGNLTAAGSMNWYTVEVTDTQTYRFWWNERGSNGDGSKTGDVHVQAKYADDSYAIGSTGTPWQDTAWGSAQSFVANRTGTVYVAVRPYAAGATYIGTYGIVYSTGSTRPILDTMEFTGVTATGTPGTTALTLTFNKPVPGLTASDITLTKTGTIFDVSKGTLSDPVGDGPSVYTLPISSPINETLSVAVARTGIYTINGSPQTGVAITGSAVPLVADEWTDGDLASGTSVVWHAIAVTNNQTYYVWKSDKSQGNGTHTASVVQFQARYSDDGAFVIGNSSSWVDPNWRVSQSFTATKNGTVYVAVRPYSQSAGNAGTYGILFSTTDTMPGPGSGEPDYTNAIELTANQWEDGELPNWNSVDTYSFTVAADTTYRVWFNQKGPDNGNRGDLTKTAYVQVRAEYSDKTSIFTWQDNGWTSSGSSTSFTPTTGGTVYLIIRVSNELGGYTGTYGIAFNTGNTLPPKDTVELISVTPVGTSETGTTALTLTFDKPIPDFSAADITLTLTPSGLFGITKGTLSGDGPVYTLGVSSVTDGTVTVAVAKTLYDISGSPAQVAIYGDGGASITELTENVWANGDLLAGSSADWYKITVTAGTAYYVWWNGSWKGDNTKGSDAVASAWYANGSNVFGDNNNAVNNGWDSASTIPATNPGGTVYVRVKPYNASDSYKGTYGIVFSTTNTRPSTN